MHYLFLYNNTFISFKINCLDEFDPPSFLNNSCLHESTVTFCIVNQREDKSDCYCERIVGFHY